MLRRVALRGHLPACQPRVRSAPLANWAAVKSTHLPQDRRPLVASPLLGRFGGAHALNQHVSTCSVVQKRCCAAASKPKEGSEKEADLEAEKEKEDKSVLRKFYGAGTVVGGGAIAYGAWWCINSAMKLVGTVYSSPHIVAYVGFWFGFGSASCCAALATGLYRLSFIRPEGAFGDTFKVVKNNDAVKAVLGENIRDGKLRSYEVKGGRFTVSGAMPRWIPHKLQMMYQVYGEKGMGLVTTVVEKKPSLIPRALDPTLLAVDFLDKDKINKDQETLLIIGEKGDLEVRDNIHRLMDLKLDFATGQQK